MVEVHGHYWHDCDWTLLCYSINCFRLLVHTETPPVVFRCYELSPMCAELQSYDNHGGGKCVKRFLPAFSASASGLVIELAFSKKACHISDFSYRFQVRSVLLPFPAQVTDGFIALAWLVSLVSSIASSWLEISI